MCEAAISDDVDFEMCEAAAISDDVYPKMCEAALNEEEDSEEREAGKVSHNVKIREKAFDSDLKLVLRRRATSSPFSIPSEQAQSTTHHGPIIRSQYWPSYA